MSQTEPRYNLEGSAVGAAAGGRLHAYNTHTTNGNIGAGGVAYARGVSVRTCEKPGARAAAAGSTGTGATPSPSPLTLTGNHGFAYIDTATRCEDHGYQTITTIEECTEASQALGTVGADNRFRSYLDHDPDGVVVIGAYTYLAHGCILRTLSTGGKHMYLSTRTASTYQCSDTWNIGCLCSTGKFGHLGVVTQRS